MAKLAIVVSVLIVLMVVKSSCQIRLIRPTYRPPPRPRQPIIRTVREAPGSDVSSLDLSLSDVTAGEVRHERSAGNGYDNEPLWLYNGDDIIRAPSSADHPVLPSIIDDVKLGETRHARSLSTPGRGRVGSNDGEHRGNRTVREAPGSDVSSLDLSLSDVTAGEVRHERSAGNGYDNEPLWLYSGDDIIRAPSSADHPVLPSIIDDVKLGETRHARSLSTPGRGRVGSNDGEHTGNRGQDTGATHPGYNRRNTRSIHLPDFVTTPPFNPKPWPGFPKEKPKIPIYV